MAIKNYLKNAEEITAPLNWKSSPESPPTQLAYITQPEIDLLVKANLHGSMKGKPNKGPKGIISLDGLGAEDTSVGEEKISDKPFSSNIVSGYTGSGSQSGNQMGPGGPGSDTYNPNLSSQNQLAAIVANKENLVNQPGEVNIPNKFNKIMKGVTNPNAMNSAQQAIYNFYASSTPNAYQQAINNFIQNPANMEVYKKSGLKGAGLNAFMTTAPQNFFGNTIAGNIIKSLTAAKEGIGGLKEKIANVINPKFEDPYSQASSSYNYDDLNIEGYPDEIQRRLQIGPISEEDTSETNIEAIKDEKNIFKSNKIKNAQDTFSFYNTLNNPSNVLPPNFAETFERLKDTNQLSSGDFLKANQLLKDIVPTNPNPPMINAQTTGIKQVLPKEVQTANNLFSNFQPNITPVVDKVSEYSKILSDNEGLDIDPLNQGVSYSTPLFGGTLTGEISDVGGDNPTAGLFFNKVI